MATGTAPSNAAASPEAAPHPYADLVEDHVRRTQGYLRSCDIAGAVITIVVFVLGYLMAMALIDHWIWPGGLGRGGRLLACLTMLVLVGVYAWRSLVPHLLRRINPIYAADRLERAQPSLMNSLVNLLMLRSQERPISDGVMRGLERQAATGIEHLPAEAAVDRRKLLRTAYVLVGVLLFCALYVVFSPKSPLISAARILIPWADIPAVTRVRIEKVRPGSEDVYRGEPVTVTAEIRGLRDDESVTLRYASVDGQTDNQSVAMFRREGQTTHSCQLPPDTAGMQRDLDYQIVAGDTKSAEFRLHVVPAPTIQIESIEYRYPAYTGMPPLTVERLGDIKGLEGTQVVIRAKSSQPITTASVQLSGLRDTTLPMQTRGELAARVELPLKLVNVQGGRDPQYTSYKLDVTNAKGNHNREPASYRIEVTPDLPPQVDVFEPKERDIQLPADTELSIEVRARDADFALSDVRLLATRKGERLLDESLVKDNKIRLDQSVRTAYRFVPAQHGLKAGDEVLFRVAAIDNKRPQPNRQLTPEYRIAIVAPETTPMQKREPNQQEDMQREGTPNQQGDPVAAGKAPKGEQGKAGDKRSSQDPSNKNPSGGDEQEQRADNSGASGSKSPKGEKGEKGDKSGKGEKGEGEGSQSGSGSEAKGSEGSEQQKDGASKSKDEGSGAASDSASAGSDPIDDGEAVQRIVKHLEQQGKKPEDQQQSGDSSGSKSGDESQMASADKQDGKQDSKQDSKQKDSQKPDKQDSKNPPKDDQQGSQQPDSKDQSGSSPGEKSSDQKQGEKQDGDKGGQKKDGQQQGNQKSQGGQKQGQSQSGGTGKSEQQGSQSGSQGNSSGQGKQSSGDQQGSSKESQSKEGSSSSSTLGQKGSSSSDSKQAGSGDRQSQQAQNSPSNKSSSGASQADSKQQGSQPGDQTAQKQPGEGTANQQAKGEKQSGSQSAQDKTASAEQRAGDKSQGQASGDKQSAEMPKGDGSNKDGGNKDDIAKKLEKKNPGQEPERGKKPDDQVASRDPTEKQQSQKQPGQKQSGPEKSGTEKSGEGQSAEQQKGEGTKPPGMNPGERDPLSQPQKQPSASDGGKPQSGGAQGRQQEDGSSSEGNRPEDKAKDIAQKSGESSDNRASGDAKDTPQDKARAPGKTPAKGQQAASDSKTSEEDSKAPEKQRPSDTGSDQGGERAGKGQEGMGQASSGAGGGSAGKSQAADDGGSRSQQSGPGDQSNRAGNQQQTDKATGKAGQQAGDARNGRPENDQRQSGDSQRQPEDGQPSEPNPQAPQGMQPGEGQQVEGQAAEQASGSGGDPAAGRSGPSSSKPSGTVVPGSEQANLEYSKRATDLTLTYLQDQLAKGRIDDGLRKRLGWSEEEFQSLLKRMQSMRDRGSDAAAKPEDKQAYEQWLKSLGLRPSTGAVRTGKVESKPLANSRDDAPVSVPRDLREQHEAFRQGLLEKSR